MKIGLCGNISLDSLATHLDRAMPDTDIVVGRPNEFANELSECRGELASCDVCIIALDWQELAPKVHGFSFGDNADDATSEFRKACNDLEKILGEFRSVCTAKIFIFSPISGQRSPAGFINRLLQPSQFELFSLCQTMFNELCRSRSDVYPVDLEGISSAIGKDNAFDPVSRFSDLYQPFSAAMTNAIVGHIHAMCEQFQKYPLKCLVLDCDNTLWGGIVGETGPKNILLSDTGPGKAYHAFQQEIVRLYKQGVILSVCSKNDTCDVLEAMEKHPHMLIRPGMVSSFRINWDDKPKNMLQISAELKIGLDSMMFVDDSPSERGMMAATLPEVTVLDLPQDPAHFAECLKKCTRFWPLQLTKDDTAKGSFFQQEQKRREAGELAANLEEYLVGSAITAFISRVTGNSPLLPRIAQLFNKTNQFNLTTKRFSESELSRLSLDPTNALFSLSMKDAYGDYGVIAAALVAGETIDSFLLSCRAFGKRAETAFAAFLLRFLRDAGRIHAFGRYRPSPKNGMAKNFYRDLGFSLERESPSESLWRFDLKSVLPETPRWISVNVVNSQPPTGVGGLS